MGFCMTNQHNRILEENKIHLGDCLDLMRLIPDKSIDLVLTDPPYGIGYDAGSYGFGTTPKQTIKKGWDGGIPSQEYFDEIFRISRNQIIFGGNYFTDYLKPVKSWIVWDKVGALKLSNPFSQCELIWTSLNITTKKITFLQQGFINDDKNENKFREHPTQKPLNLFQQILNDYSQPNDLILDPFSGSGTTAIAAHNLGRRFICIEKDPDYHAASVQRLKDTQAQLRLF